MSNRDDMVNGMPRLMCEMVVCPKCGDKRCPHADDHRNDCTGSEPTMSQYAKTKMIEFTEGEFIGQKAYVTFEDGDGYLRVTLVEGDPLCSIELSRQRGGFKELKGE